MNQEQLEMKLEARILKIEEVSRFYAGILENITDEGSTVTVSGSDEALCTMREKIDFLIAELTLIKKDAELIESVENLLYRD